MSKIQTTIQKAIERSRQQETSGVSSGPGKSGDTALPTKMESLVTGALQALRLTTPHNEIMEVSKIVAATDDRAAKTAYNVLRTRILQRIRSNNWRAIVVTSPGPGEGKTLTATNLAMSLARDVNQETVLVDLDLNRSSVAKYLGIDVDISAGVGDYLQDRASISELLYSPVGIDRLTIVPNREPVANSSDLIASPKMKELVRQLGALSNKNIVIYDMPPVLVCDDVLAFYPNVDAILLVVAQGKTERKALEKTTSMLSGLEMLGVVLNMSNEHAGDEAYEYY